MSEAVSHPQSLRSGGGRVGSPPVHPLPIAFATAVGCIGSFGSVGGRGPVTLAHEYRAPALLTLVAVAIVVAGWFGRVVRPRAIVAMPILLLAGAAATWPTAGRVQGIWCVAATASAVAMVRVMSQSERSPTRILATALALVGIAFAGITWALAGPGPAGIVVLGVSVGAGSTVTRDRRLVTVGDRLLRSGATSTRELFVRARRWPARLTVRSSMAVCGAVATGFTAPVMHRLASSESTQVAGFNDFRSHLDLAAQLNWSPPRLTIPHPMFHILVSLLRPLLGEPWAVTVVLSGAVGLAVASLIWIATLPIGGAPGLSAQAAPLFALGFLVSESPGAALQAVGLLGTNSRYAAVHLWASPTETILLPFVFLLVIKVVEIMGEPHPRRRLLATTALLAMGATLAKPALTLALIPALVILVALDRSVASGSRRALTGVVLIPSATIVLWQVWFLAAGNLPQGKSEFSVRPMATIRSLRIGQDGPWFWSALAIVVVAFWVGGRSLLNDRTIQLTLAALGCALVILLLFFEGGIRQNDGNLAKPAYFTWLLLFAWSLRFVIASLVAHRERRPPGEQAAGWVWASLVVLATLLAGGVAAWSDALGIIRLSGWGVAA